MDAGSALLEYHDYVLANWRRSIRVPLLVMVALGFGMIAIVEWVFPHHSFVAGAFLGGTEAALLVTWTEPPHRVRKWKLGGEGERRTGRELARLVSAGWKSYHSRAARYGDLDHVVIGPGGVYLLDSKNLDGALSVDARGLTQSFGDSERDSFTLSKLGNALRGEAVNLRNRIEDVAGLRCWVQAVVVVWGDFNDSTTEVENVVYVAGRELESWMRARPKRLSDRDVSLLQLGMESEDIVRRAPPLFPST